jgi:hypothetical protein
MANALSLDDFIDLLGRFGADVANWPLSETELQAVVVLLSQSPAARDAVAEMRMIEGYQQGTAPQAPIGLADRMLAASGVAALGQPIRVRARSRRPQLH